MSASQGASPGLDAYLDVEEKESRKIQTGNLRQLAARILRHRLPFLGGLFMVFLGTAAALTEPWLFGYAIDHAILPKNGVLLQRLVLLYLLVVCVRVSATISQGYLFEVSGQRVTQDLRVALFSHLQRLPIAVFDKNPAGRLLTRVTNDIASLSEMFSAGFVSMISNLLLVLGIIAGLMVMNLRLGLIASSVFPVLVIVSAYFSRRLKISYRDARSKLSALNAFLAENLLGMKVIHLFNREKLHLTRFDRINEWYAEAQVGTVRVFALFQPSITIASGVSVALVIYFGGHKAAAGEISLGMLAAYFSYVLSLFQPVREIADKWNFFLSGMSSAERIFSVLDWPVELTSAGAQMEEATALENVAGKIVFENVWFAYEGEHWVLRDFSVEIRSGMRVGVVGHTGAGKTTLISLLLRFYEPQRGRILLDGKDIREIDRRSLRRAIGIVQQDVFVFSGSFRDNITFWDSSQSTLADSALVKRTLGGLGFEKWWNDDRTLTPIAGDHLASQGRDREAPKASEPSELQERGSNLSIGERQVLAFARALAKGPGIWILDEATANMDSQTESLLNKALEEGAQDKTTILIAHRLSTVKDADLVLVLHKGTLLEKGNHDQLLKKNGLYARLYRFQTLGSANPE